MSPFLFLYATWAQSVNQVLASPGLFTFLHLWATTAGYELAAVIVIGFCLALANQNHWQRLIRWWLKWGLALPFTITGYLIVGGIALVRTMRR